MELLTSFLSEFEPVFIGVTVSISIVWGGKRCDPDALPPILLNRRNIEELKGRSEDEQQRLLREATREAFRGWRGMLAILAFSSSVAVTIALGNTSLKALALPDSAWLRSLVAGGCAAMGAWLGGRFLTKYVRSVLRKVLARAHVTA